MISFNYDRTIRRFLPFALDSQFAIGNKDATELSRQLQIFHPYGSLGPLELEGKSGTIPFGAKHADLRSVARNIRTFTEQIEDKDHLAEMRAKLSKANRIVFLGFGYLSQNMELLTVDTIGHASQVLGTSYGLSEPDNELVTNQLSEFFHENYRSHKSARLSSVKCAQFIRENFRTLTS